MDKNICYCSPEYSEIAKSVLKNKFPSETFAVKPLSDLRLQGIFRLIRDFRHYDKASCFTYDLDVQRSLFQYTACLVWISRKTVFVIDTKGKSKEFGWKEVLLQELPSYFFHAISQLYLILRIRGELSNLEKQRIDWHPLIKEKDRRAIKLAYLRTDLIFGTKAGGSVGHIAGVINGFSEWGGKAFVVTTDTLELVNGDKTPFYLVKPKGSYDFFSEIPELHYNQTLFKDARPIFQRERPDLVYQRYSLNNFTGAALAREFRLPFILEYNGSEVWVARNWGRRLRHEKLASRIEILNFNSANLISVVSKPLQEELLSKGLSGQKIIVNPNGVDPERYRPDIDGNKIRQQYGLRKETVIGFIGTFGNWHGAPVLAKAAVKLVKEIDETKETHFLFIGDGVTLPETKKIIKDAYIEGRVTFTGLVPQEYGSEYLAACDILVAPHVPNPDGSPFFGSPTKLFEYMAMGKGIVASKLDQMAEVLEHGKTAWMTVPGNADDLAAGIMALVRNPELRSLLGKNARAEVLKKYTWKQHVDRTMSRLIEVLKNDPQK